MSTMQGETIDMRINIFTVDFKDDETPHRCEHEGSQCFLKSPIYWGILGHNCKFCSYPASERWMDTEEKSELKDIQSSEAFALTCTPTE